MDAAHARQGAQLDRQLKGVYMDSALTSLQTGLTAVLTKALIHSNAPDAAAKFVRLRSTMAERVNEFKREPIRGILLDFELWATNEAGEKLGVGEVAEVFKMFREDLQKVGVSFE